MIIIYYIFTARGEGYVGMNDLGAPAPLTLPERQDSVELSSKYTVDSLETNIKELNIKPDVIKAFSESKDFFLFLL